MKKKPNNKLPLTSVEKVLPMLVKNALANSTSDKAFSIFLADLQLTSRDWNELLTLANKQGLLAIAYDGLPDDILSVLPRDIRIKWQQGVEMVENRYERAVSVLKELIIIFNTNGIDVLLLKGPGISSIYPQPNHRESDNLNIYLLGDFDKGNNVIEQKGIFVEKTRNENSRFNFRGVSVENHKTFVGKKDKRINLTLNRLLSNNGLESLLLGDFYVNVPAPDFNAFFLAEEYTRQFLSEGLVIRHFSDIALFFKTNYERINFNKLSQLLYCHRIVNIFLHFLSLSDNMFGFDSGYRTLVKRTKNDQEPNNVTVDKIYSDTLNNTIKRKEKQVLRSMPLYKRKISETVTLFTSKWKYDLISKGLFYKVFLKKFILYSSPS